MNVTLIIWVAVATLISVIGNLWAIFWKAEKIMQSAKSATDQWREDAKKDLATNFKSITERLDQQQIHNESTPHHNSTFYFNALGESMNLSHETWSFELEQDHKELIKNNKIGVLTVYVRKNKIIFDKFVLDFKGFSEKHEDYPIVQHGVKLMKQSELNANQLHFVMLNEFISGVHARGTIYHNQATNMLIYSFIQHVRPLFEAEKAKLEKEEADKKASETGGSVFENALVRAITCSKQDAGIITEDLKNKQILYNGDVLECPTTLLTINNEVLVVVTNKKDEEDWIVVYEDKDIVAEEKSSEGLRLVNE